MAKPIPHGTASGYVYHKCRCEICKSAESERKKRWREANPDHRRKSWEANKARDSEKNRIWREANPDYRRRHYEANREKAAEDVRRWREANPEKYRESQRRWREANPEICAENRRRFLEANPDYFQDWRDANPDSLRLWKEANPERFAELRRLGSDRRRARIRDAFVEDVPRLEIFERDNWECLIPGCLYPGVPTSPDAGWPDPLFATIDHVIPLAKGGLHERSNLACAHLRCNTTKGDRLEGIA